MPDKFKALANKTLQHNILYCRPPAALIDITANDPALKVMTDFRKIRAITTQLGTSIVDCNQHMIMNNVRLLLVTDDKKEINGIITAADILGEKPLLHMQKTGYTRDEIQAKDIMTVTTDLETLQLDDVEGAKIGDIVATLLKDGRQHAIVTCGSFYSDEIMICGMFSATHIGRQLGISIQPTDIAKSFSELEKVIAG